MEVTERIRTLREINQWSQEEMAEKMNVSTNTYARLERGETRLSLDKLEKIAMIFNINVLELIASSTQGIFSGIKESELFNNGVHSFNFYNCSNDLVIENEKLKLTNTHQAEMLAQKDREIEILKSMVVLLERNLNGK